MHVSLWLNTVEAVQMFYIERIFVFFETLFLKMGIISSASKPHCHSRLSKSVLKILSTYRNCILGKQLSQKFALNFRLFHTPESQISSTKLNMMIKIVKLFTAVLWKSCSHEFYRKKPMQESLFNKVSRLRAKKGSCTDVFRWALTNISERFFCKTHLDDCFC